MLEMLAISAAVLSNAVSGYACLPYAFYVPKIFAKTAVVAEKN